MVVYLDRLKQIMPIKQTMAYSRLGQQYPSRWLETYTHQTMTKSLEVISEAVRNPKHPFRKVDNQPKKPRKHRYERRKIKEYLHLGDWATEAA
jgi:hypothetical protein